LTEQTSRRLNESQTRPDTAIVTRFDCARRPHRTLSSENTPPEAVDDQFYSGLGQTVTLSVLDNDDDPDWDG
jgi:hypothetical protein